IVAGLIAGGLLVTYASWRWVMFVNVPIGLVVAALAARVLPETGRRGGRLDLPGALTATAGVALLVYGLSNAATTPDGVSHWGDAKVVASLAAAAVLLAAFAVIEARSSHPLLPFPVLRNRDRSGAYLISLCTGPALIGMFFFLTLFVQGVWGYSALKTAAAYLPFVPAVLATTALTQQGVNRIGPRPLLIAGSAVAAGGMFWASRLPEHSTVAGGVAGPDLSARGRPGPPVRAHLPGRADQGGQQRHRRGLWPGQHRAAGRRRDRAGDRRHRGLERGGQHPAIRGRRRRGGAGWRAPVRRPGGRAEGPDRPPRAGHRVLPGLPGLGRRPGTFAGHRAVHDAGRPCGPVRPGPGARAGR